MLTLGCHIGIVTSELVPSCLIAIPLVPQKPRGVPTIPTTFGYLSSQEEVLESTNLVWNHLQNI